MSCLIQTGHIKDLLTTKGNDNAKAQFINLSTNVRDLERQLDASQALLAEAEYQIEKQTIETRAATQLASDYIKQLAETRAENERLTLENRQMLQGMKWDNQLIAEARQEAARSILQIISMETIDRPFEQSQAVEIIRQRYILGR